MKKIASLIVLALAFAAGVIASDSVINPAGAWYKLSLTAENGFVTVLSHTIQFGKEGSKFDYKEDGNQDVLFPFSRYQAAVRLFDTHSIVFLYQPLEFLTETKIVNDTRFYDTVFPGGTPLEVRYSFSFYRASYVWYFAKEGANELGAGISMQVRNASIRFKAIDGSDIIINENVGPVPIIKLVGKYAFDSGLWLGLDADGFYASSAIFNGAEFPFVGAIWDASLRAGLKLDNGINPFVNFRILGGGANGTSKNVDAQGDGFTDNWLNTFTLTLGVTIE